MVVVHPPSQGLAAMTLAIAHSRGWLNYDERVCTYWPEFAQRAPIAFRGRAVLGDRNGLALPLRQGRADSRRGLRYAPDG
jgi:CubicO group peptidase (beta-lactamase class C family)